MKQLRYVFDALLYIVVFLLVQWVVTVAVQVIGADGPMNLERLMAASLQLPTVKAITIISAVSSVLTLLLFLLLRWARPARSYLRTWPWAVYVWVVVLALGTIIPSEALAERLPDDMTPELKMLLQGMLQSRWGYVAVSILTPLAEELVFRGAVLRVLLLTVERRWHWVPIVVSALLFGLVHGNVQQGVHAALIGLLLGWMYYRTQSIVPGVLFHWVNNSVAYVVANLMPQAADASLSDLLAGGERSVLLAVVFSLCIALPALFQLNLRLRRPRI